MKLDLQHGARTIGRGVGLGVAEAMQAKNPTTNGEETGWRAEQVARGFLRGIERGLEDVHFREVLTDATAAAVGTVIAAAVTHAPSSAEMSERAARAFTRGVLEELRAQLGDEGTGRLSLSLGASTHQIARQATKAFLPIAIAFVVLVSVAIAGVLVGALLVAR